jgi:hypothetical protein
MRLLRLQLMLYFWRARGSLVKLVLLRLGNERRGLHTLGLVGHLSCRVFHDDLLAAGWNAKVKYVRRI